MNAWDKKMRANKAKAGILHAAIKIAGQNGWDALSMRKIAMESKCSLAIIYSCFKSKNLLLNEFIRQGYSLLYREIAGASAISSLPELRLAHMWQAYWNFAISHEPHYRLMFGIGTTSCEISAEYPESRCFITAFKSTIKSAIKSPGVPDEFIDARLLGYWSVVHGLICLNMEKKGTSTEMNGLVLMEIMHVLSASLLATA